MLIGVGRIQFVPMTDDGSAKPTTLVTSASPDAGKLSSLLLEGRLK